MNYEAFAISRLKDYPFKSVSLVNLADEIKELRARQVSAKVTRTDKEMVQGANTNRAQDAALNMIATIDEKIAIYRRNHRELARMDRALDILSESDRAVLNAFFLYPVTDPVQHLKETMGYERTRIYDMRREAIRHFAKAYYGAVDV